MTAIDLLQQIGLNKYEAEAYYTLLAEGPLTGYELGKRSAIPLSRGYDVLDRLARRGLALVQPGDPPHYAAQDPGQFLGQARAVFAGTLDSLAGALAGLPRRETDGELWVLRRRQHILARARAMIDAARWTVALDLVADADPSITEALAHTRTRGLQIIEPAAHSSSAGTTILLLVDDHEALVGTIIPPDHCQAVVTANAALVAAVQGYFAQQRFAQPLAPVTNQRGPLDWVAWEERKQRRLRQRPDDGRVA